jgi:hypothetical protein
VSLLAMASDERQIKLLSPLTSGRLSKLGESFEIPNSNFNKFVSESDILKALVDRRIIIKKKQLLFVLFPKH